MVQYGRDKYNQIHVAHNKTGRSPEAQDRCQTPTDRKRLYEKDSQIPQPYIHIIYIYI